MDSIRINYNRCSEQSFSLFIKNINKNKDFTFKSHNPADSSVMQDRYAFGYGKNRVSVVYETKAQTLIITASKAALDAVTNLLPPEIKNANAEQRVAVGDKKNSRTTLPQKSLNKPDDQAKAAERNSKSTQNVAKKRAATGATSSKKTPSKSKNSQNLEERSKTAKATKKTNSKSEVISGTNKFTIKKVDEDKFGELLKKIRQNKTMRYKLVSSDEAKTYVVTAANEKVTLRYDGDVLLAGNRGDLYSEVQLMLSQISDYKTAIKSHIKQGGGLRAQDVERQLKKKLPFAYEFLSEQSKIDLAIGIIDINNSSVVLSDYSTLLIPCFRGLERLIFDLQHAQGIMVKMIGQAYEKENGNYVLKSGYRKKIPSVIYAEVMAALYTEYFKHRNFYAHSDGGFDNVSRVITDKLQVQTIYNQIMDVINYNGKKLQEIGFSIQ